MKNIIFDLVNVLVNFHPRDFVDKHVLEEKREKIFRLILQGEEWQKLDRGTITQQEALESFLRKMPEEKETICKIFPRYLTDCLSPNQENIKLVYELKKRGYSLYVLSNFHKNLFEKIQKEWEVFQQFDGKIISCYHHFLKPEKEIYELLFKTYQINPEESVFVDDSLENIEMARELGVLGIHLPIREELSKKLSFLLER